MTTDAPERPKDWVAFVRVCEQRLRMRKWEVMRYTPSQLDAALSAGESAHDPHAGNIPIESEADLLELLGGV